MTDRTMGWTGRRARPGGLREDYPAWLLRAALSIPSVSGQELPLAGFLAEQLDTLGFDAHVDEVGNVHGVIGPDGGPTVMLLGHIDTVPGQVPVCQVGDLLYGRGSVDAKGAFVTMICAAARSREVRVHVVGAVGEEVAGSRGARHVMATVPRPDAVVIGEPSGWDGVCLGYKGRIGLGYEMHQPPLHTSSPEPTAVERAAAFARDVQDYLRGLSPEQDPVAFGVAAGTLIRLCGDLASAEAFLTCRVPPGFDFAALERFARSRTHSRIWVDERVPGVTRTRADPVVSQLRAAIAAQGARPTFKRKAGTSDMNTLDPWGLPMAAYGPGDAHLDHTTDEHIPISELYRAIDVLAVALPRLGRQLAATPSRQPEPVLAGALPSNRPNPLEA
ncbi:M20/M25/M40 family metallo-hydrolase [Dactylosporangium aurantiacum]|uniref:M20/M25/M40 family metallo-hydrolase n=1 Tax=Dactylosporangium aurantiacum TaxID=35754 RepID=A0A9Q9IPK0_9ACTN|nr:M20/M25/M40 family metallo-hydrolase [Dactylosporangium aurantiacum]MDG6103019.1 M20/M25/M40 family metallo-hydrolase [Dactylosporangium aurantiacum]UWZ57532.1 M20/M25/M40 family metallo-hydrolase [Dactylosporangium aurantiacum]